MKSRHLQAEHLRPDDDAEQKLEHDSRHEQPARRHQHRQRARHGRRRDDGQELTGLHLDGSEDGEHGRIASAPVIQGIIRIG